MFSINSKVRKALAVSVAAFALVTTVSCASNTPNPTPSTPSPTSTEIPTSVPNEIEQEDGIPDLADGTPDWMTFYKCTDLYQTDPSYDELSVYICNYGPKQEGIYDGFKIQQFATAEERDDFYNTYSSDTYTTHYVDGADGTFYLITASDASYIETIYTGA